MRGVVGGERSVLFMMLSFAKIVKCLCQMNEM